MHGMAMNITSNDRGLRPMIAFFVRAGDRPPALRSRDRGGASMGSTLFSLQQ